MAFDFVRLDLPIRLSTTISLFKLMNMRDLLEERTPVLEGPTRNYRLYLLAICHFRLGNVQLCLHLPSLRDQEQPDHPHIVKFVEFLQRNLNTHLPVRVGTACVQGLAFLGGLYEGCCIIGPPVLKGLKHLAKNNVYYDMRGMWVWFSG